MNLCVNPVDGQALGDEVRGRTRGRGRVGSSGCRAFAGGRGRGRDAWANGLGFKGVETTKPARHTSKTPRKPKAQNPFSSLGPKS